MSFESNAANASSHPVERPARELEEQIDQLRSQVASLQNTVDFLESRIHASADRYVAVCPGCRTRFDMLAHHYSIGLFDNLVYVKCPKCHKALPVKGGSGGEITTVED